MRKALFLAMVAMATCALGSAAWAQPTVDGMVLPGDGYLVTLTDLDAPGASFQNTGLDIDTLHFSADTGWFYMALVTVGKPLDPNGDPTSELFQTDFWAVFYDNAHTTRSYKVEVEMDGGGVSDVVLQQWNGGGWTNVALDPADYDVDLGDGSAAGYNDLELRIKNTKMPNLAAAPYVFAQLDGTGEWGDDQIAGVVPEPATIALLAIGLAGAVVSRRRR